MHCSHLLWLASYFLEWLLWFRLSDRQLKTILCVNNVTSLDICLTVANPIFMPWPYIANQSNQITFTSKLPCLGLKKAWKSCQRRWKYMNKTTQSVSLYDVRCMTFADSRLQTADCRLQIFKLISQFPFPLPRANRKQANLSAIQANLSDIQANQSAI